MQSSSSWRARLCPLWHRNCQDKLLDTSNYWRNFWVSLSGISPFSPVLGWHWAITVIMMLFSPSLLTAPRVSGIRLGMKLWPSSFALRKEAMNFQWCFIACVVDWLKLTVFKLCQTFFASPNYKEVSNVFLASQWFIGEPLMDHHVLRKEHKEQSIRCH